MSDSRKHHFNLEYLIFKHFWLKDYVNIDEAKPLFDFGSEKDKVVLNNVDKEDIDVDTFKHDLTASLQKEDENNLIVVSKVKHVDDTVESDYYKFSIPYSQEEVHERYSKFIDYFRTDDNFVQLLENKVAVELMFSSYYEFLNSPHYKEMSFGEHLEKKRKMRQEVLVGVKEIIEQI